MLASEPERLRESVEVHLSGARIDASREESTVLARSSGVACQCSETMWVSGATKAPTKYKARPDAATERRQS